MKAVIRLKRGQIHFSSHHLETLEELKQSESAVSLEIRGVDLEVLPIQLGQIQNLEILEITLGAICDWPELFWQLPNLKRLKIVSTQGLILPDKLHGTVLPQLQSITIKGAGLVKLPSWFYDLTTIEELSLPDNKILSLESKIIQFKNIKRINLQNNKINKLPEEIYQLEKLNHLNLDNNFLNELTKKKIFQRWKILLD